MDIKNLKNTLLLVALAIQPGCNKIVSLNSSGSKPEQVFDDMWSTMNKNYALFPVKGISWDSVYSIYRPQVNASSDNEALFSILSETLETLKDGHVSLSSPTDTSVYTGFFKGYPLDFNLVNIKKYYLKNVYNTKGPVIYKIQNGVGYLYYGSFKDNISETDLDLLFSELTGTKGLIIDVRSNGGGNLSNVNRLFGRFIHEPMLVKYEVVKSGPGHSAYATENPIYATPSGPLYDKPVVVLTNRSCYSACNDFALFMSYLSDVQLVGDQTGGGGAIPANYLLSNGWKLEYPASMTLSRERIPVENGIPPDIRMDINSIDDAIGRDPILEKAFELLQ